MIDKQELVKQVFNARYAQLQHRRDEALRVNRVHKRAIVAQYRRWVNDLNMAYLFDLQSKCPLCLNPTLNLRPKLIRTRWGVLFA